MFLGLSDAGDEVVADLDQTGPGGRVWTQQRAAQAAVLVDAGGVVRAPAVADGDFALLEVTDELGGLDPGWWTRGYAAS